MEEILFLRNEVGCLGCRRKYGENCQMYFFEGCGHHTCYNCFRDRDVRCRICDTETKIIEIPLVADTAKILDNCISLLKNSKKIENDLRKDNGLLRKENEDLIRDMENIVNLKNPEDCYTCAECETRHNDQTLYLCETCHRLDFEDTEDVIKHAICSECSIKKHIRKEHQLVDFFPYLSAHRFSNLSKEIACKSDELKDSQAVLNDTVLDIDILIKRVSRNIDLLTDVARRSKTSQFQLETFAKIESLMEESKNLNTRMSLEMKNKSIELQNSLTCLDEWLTNKTADVRGESQIIKLCTQNFFTSICQNLI